MNRAGRETAKDETPREERDQIRPRRTVVIGRQPADDHRPSRADLVAFFSWGLVLRGFASRPVHPARLAPDLGPALALSLRPGLAARVLPTGLSRRGSAY